MNAFESVLATISPRLAYAREAWRQGLADLKRNYDAGGYGRSNANWRAMNESADQTDRDYRDIVRARARDLERNSDLCKMVVLAYKRNVVGKGFILQARTDDERINEQIEQAWKIWSKKENCDITGTQSFNQILRMSVERKKVDGGILVLKCYNGPGRVPLCLQTVEVDELDTSQLTPHSTGNRVVGGIEYNLYNRAVGYHIKKYSLDGLQPQEPVYVPAEYVIFYFSKHRPSQVREMSDMAVSVSRIRDANEFMTAVSVKERIAACLAVFIKRSLPSGGVPGRQSADAGDRMSYEGKTLAPGMIREMNAGDEIQVVDPSGAATDAAAFTKIQTRLVGAGQGLSYESVSRDMSETNYSSARQNAIEDEVTFAEEIELLKENLMSEIYKAFLDAAILAGVVSARDYWSNREQYLHHEWVRAPKPWIDPAKEATANQVGLRSGQKTYKEICAENGRDWKSSINDIADVFEYGKRRGLDLSPVIFGANTTNAMEEKKGGGEAG